MYDLTIKAAINGFIVRAGCARIVFKSKEALMKALDKYLDDPESVEAFYREKSCNAKILGYRPADEARNEAIAAPIPQWNVDED